MFTDAQIKTVVQSALEFIPPNKTLEPGPAQHPAGPKAALRHCCVAWKRAFKAYMEDPNADVPGDELFASKDAGEAYRNAMPLLVGYNGARDFIACAAHGILIGAIAKDEGGQLLYAAQVALSIAQSENRQPKRPVGRPRKSASNSASKINTPVPLNSPIECVKQ